MANTVFDNVVIEAKASDLLASKIGARTLMTIDNTLEGSEGMTKLINTYTYNGSVEELAAGVGNTTRGTVSYVSKEYKVKMMQQAFDYTDEDFMMDANVVDMGVRGASDVMANTLNNAYYGAINGASLETSQFTNALNYNDIVDAIAEMRLEDESGLFLLVGRLGKAALRKDADYKAAQLGQVIYNGQVGTIAGIPVICTKDIADDSAILATKEAVTCFVKKNVEVEQARNADQRKNSIYMRQCYIVAVTNSSRARFLTKKTV